MKRKKYNTGGAVDSLSQMLGALGPIGQGAGLALQGANALLTDPSNYIPVRQNTMSGYNNGGLIPQQQMQQETTANRRTMTRPEGTYQKAQVPGDSSPLLSMLFNAFEGPQGAANYRSQTRANQQAVQNYNNKVAPYEGKFDTTAMDRNARSNYNSGGDIPLNSQGMEVQGNAGIDTNARNVAGTNVNLTQGETVQGTDSGAFVFSDKPDMLDPYTGKTFAQAAKKYQKVIGKAEKALERNPSDKLAKKTIEESNKQLEKIAQRQQLLNNNHQGESQEAPQGGNFNYGGIVTAAMRNASPYMTGAQLMSNTPFVTYPTTNMMQGTPAARTLPNSNTIPVSQNPIDPLANAKVRGGLASPTIPGSMLKQKGFQNTIGDKVNLATMGVETLGRFAQAGAPAENIANDKYAVSRQIYNPANALDKNTRNYNANMYNINTGNANTDRVLRTNSYATKMNTDRDTIAQYDQMQRQSDQQIEGANKSSQYQVDVNNTQNEGARNSAISGALTQMGALGAEFQDYSNARYDNNITLGSLNALSTHYGIDVKTLQALAKNDPQAIERMIMFKGTV